jgi:Protein of unknown function (DUF992)
MTNRVRMIVGLAALGAAASLSTIPAQAAGGVKVGVLNCNVAGGWGYILGSSKDIHCSFVPNGGTPERYTGAITKVGVDIGYTQGGVIIWDVIAPSSSLMPGALQGGYGGVTAGVTIGAGLGANVLVGGFDKSIALQPISVEGSTGLNVAAGIGEMSLHYEGPPQGPEARLESH